MDTYVALLRGVNVGGRNKIPMAVLRELCEDVGWRDVRTYVQSGNVVFTADLDHRNGPGERLTRRIEESLGFAPRVMVLDARQLTAVADANPFAEEASADPTKVHVAFAEHDVAAAATLDADGYLPERLALGDRVVYLHLPAGMGRSRLAIDLGRLDVELTVRNWRTVTSLIALADT